MAGREIGLSLVRTEGASCEVSVRAARQEPAIEDGWTVREARSASFDPDQMGRHTRPNGDIGYPLLPVPITPTASSDRRYLFRVATMAVGSEEVALLTEVEMVVQIGSVPSIVPDAGFAPANLTVSDLLWHFSDGNASYAFRYLPGLPAGGPGGTLPTPNGTSDRFYGEGSALLAKPPYVPDYLPGLPGGTPYVPLNRGEPAGSEVGDLGWMETVRFASEERSESALLAPALPGPGLLVLYASVAQTDPATRPVISFGAATAPDVGALSREDRFVQALPNVVYRKIGGSFRCTMLSTSCLDRLYGRALRGELPARFLSLGRLL